VKAKITFKFEAETEGEFCSLKCPALMPNDSIYKCCTIFGCCIPLEQSDERYKRHLKCIESEDK
jgi:hypothetical protein